MKEIMSTIMTKASHRLCIAASWLTNLIRSLSCSMHTVSEEVVQVDWGTWVTLVAAAMVVSMLTTSPRMIAAATHKHSPAMFTSRETKYMRRPILLLRCITSSSLPEKKSSMRCSMMRRDAQNMSTSMPKNGRKTARMRSAAAYVR